MPRLPSRRDLLAGLLAAGLAWLGLRRKAAAARAPVAPSLPNTETPSRLLTSYDYGCGAGGAVTTCVCDCSGRLMWPGEPTHVLTYSYDVAGQPPTEKPR
jgi:hypothetical protein